MKRVGIVILNYETYEESINCIDSIKRHHLNYEQIVIVDNASKNDSCLILNEYYREDENIHVIKLPKNLGFARGNNIGILYLRKKGINYIWMLNSDTVILKDNYLEEMLKACSGDTGVAGSRIKLPHGLEQGGEQENLSLLFSVYSFIKAVCKDYYIYFPFKYGREDPKSLRIHGCSILLTPAFFNSYECLWPYTFLYREEMILSTMMDKAKLKTQVADTWIFHKESSTTRKYWSKYSKKREKFETKSYLQQILVKLLPYILIKSIIRGWANEVKA